VEWLFVCIDVKPMT